MKVSIGKKLILSTSFMLILVLTISAVGIWSIRRVSSGADIILRESSLLHAIQELRLSFEKVLMPAHDYLIRGDKREIQNFEYLVKNLKNNILIAQKILEEHKEEKFLKRNESLLAAQERLIRIETLSKQILSLPDPLGWESAKRMKKMDALSDKMQEDLDKLFMITSKNGNSELGQLNCKLMVTFQRFLMPVHDYMIGGSISEFINYRQIEKALDSQISRAKQLTSSIEEKEIMDTVDADLKEIKTFAVQILNIPDPLKIEASKSMKEMDKITMEVTEELDSLLNFSMENANFAMKVADRIQFASTKTMIIICLIVVILALTGGVIFARGITQPVKKLVEATQRISAGDLDHEAEVHSKDEIGDLAESFNLMTEDLKKYRDELIHAKKYIDNILKSMIDSLIVITPDGKIQTTNQATLNLLGYREEDLIAQPIEKVFPYDHLILSGSGLERLLEKGAVQDYELTYQTKDGQKIPVNFSASIMKSEEGEILGVVGVARDMREFRKLIEDLKKAYLDIQITQAQLVQSSKLASLGVLSAGIAHEITNPLNVIINYAGLLEDEIDPHEETFSYVQGILKETQRVSNIIKSLLTFARQDRQEHSLIYLIDTIDSSLTFTEGCLLKEGVQIIRSYKKELPRIQGNNSQLEQVFVNLILNARDALNEKYLQPHSNKKLQITADQIVKNETKYIRIIFHDTGIGIPEEYLDKIFDPFFTTKHTDKGTGLGLSISYGIIKDHGGTLEVESKRGEYTAFVIDLPVDFQQQA